MSLHTHLVSSLLLLGSSCLATACASAPMKDAPLSLAEAQSTLFVKVTVWESVAGVQPFRKLVVEAVATPSSGCPVLHAAVTANGLPLSGAGGGYIRSSNYLGSSEATSKCLTAYYTLDVHDEAELRAPTTEIRLTDESATVQVRADNLFAAPSVAFAPPTSSLLVAGETAHLTLAHAFSDPAVLRFSLLSGDHETTVLRRERGGFTREAEVISFVVPADWQGAGNLFVEAPRDVYGHPAWPRHVVACQNAASCSVARYPAANPHALAPDVLEIVDQDPVLRATVLTHTH